MAETTVQVTLLRGLALPTDREGFAPFDSHTAYDLAWSDMLTAVLTPRGSRAGNRAFGSRLHDLLFSVGPLDTATARYMIETVVERWCPHVKVRNVSFDQTDRKSVTLLIVFSLTEDLDTEEVRNLLIPLDYVSA